MNQPNESFALAQDNNTAAAVAAGQHIGTIRELKGFKPVILKPAGADIHTLERLPELERPERIISHPKFQDPAGFIAYVNKYKTDATLIMLDLETNQVVAVIDYHEAGTDGGKPRYRSHRATYTPRLSEEWKVWDQYNKKAMSQRDFAQFLEDNLADVAEQERITLMEVALTLDANSKQTFKGGVRLQTDTYSFTFNEVVEGTAGPDGKVEIPTKFNLLLRPFIGTEAGPIVARLRFKPSESTVIMWYDLHRHDLARLAALESTADRIAQETKLTVLRGTVD